MLRFFDYSYIAATIVLTVYGQLILKWRIVQFGAFPTHFLEKVKHLFFVLIDPFVFSGFVAAFLASLTWMVAMTKFELSYAYPFMSLNFVVVLLLSQHFFNEPIGLSKIIGVGLIVIGTAVVAKG